MLCCCDCTVTHVVCNTLAISKASTQYMSASTHSDSMLLTAGSIYVFDARKTQPTAQVTVCIWWVPGAPSSMPALYPTTGADQHTLSCSRAEMCCSSEIMVEDCCLRLVNFPLFVSSTPGKTTSSAVQHGLASCCHQLATASLAAVYPQ